ncbi:hypothetical protein CC80DRAFT_144764 [Byssothecium circinans]|uniref:Uncharacterized protein n=1 Tax=Byssothecium circinans TaxID=147558 RepID=A0A6A5TLN7_9PLEO|nr:hypothetical protein CC80DRAFT_144764 [Byssothecium circinans]
MPQPFEQHSIHSTAKDLSPGSQYIGHGFTAAPRRPHFMTGSPITSTSNGPQNTQGLHFNGTPAATPRFMAGSPFNGAAGSPQFVGGMPLNNNMAAAGSYVSGMPSLQFIGDLPVGRTPTGPQSAGGPNSNDRFAGSHPFGGPNFVGPSPVPRFSQGDFTGQPIGRADLPIPPPPLHPVPQTQANRERLDARKDTREAWIKEEARKIAHAAKLKEATRIKFTLTSAQEDYNAWKAAEEVCSRLMSREYQMEQRRKLFMPRGTEPLRTGAANFPGDAVLGGSGQRGELLGFKMALMEKLGVEAANKNDGFVADGSLNGDGKEVAKEMMEHLPDTPTRGLETNEGEGKENDEEKDDDEKQDDDQDMVGRQGTSS